MIHRLLQPRPEISAICLVSSFPDAPTWKRMLDLNLLTVERSIRALVGKMVERRHGSIVVVGSRASERPWENKGAAAYVASKSAAAAYTRTVAAETIDSGVRLNVVLP